MKSAGLSENPSYKSLHEQPSALLGQAQTQIGPLKPPCPGDGKVGFMWLIFTYYIS